MKVRPGRWRAEDIAPGEELVADVCIMGAGAGGAGVALALAERGLSVAVLEEGRHFRPSDFSADTATALSMLYQGRGARSTRGNVVMPLPGGRGVGGSTLINSAICFRTPPEILATWREDYGVEALTEEATERWFDRLYASLGVTVNPVSVQRNNNLIFREGAEALGLNGSFLARSAPGCVGCGICQYGCPSGGKSSVDRSLLAEALETGNVGIYSNLRVRDMDARGDRVTGWTAQRMDPRSQEPIGELRVRARHYVVSGGPIGSPLVLLRNGMSDNSVCGRHLVVHPTAPLMARFAQEIRPWSGVTQGYYVDCWDEGFLLQTYTVTPDQYYMTLPHGGDARSLEIMRDLGHMASAGALVHDEDLSLIHI